MNIVWSPEILEDIEKVAEYLSAEWPISVWNNFKKALLKKIDLLASGLLQGRPAKRYPTVLSILISSQNRLYYEMRDDTIYLLRLWDTRQNPDRHSYE